MCSLALVLLLMFYYNASNAQPSNILKRRLDHLERRYELDSSRTSESVRELWSHITRDEDKCCRATQTRTGSEQDEDNQKTGTLKDRKMENLDKEIEVLRKAFTDEKETVRTLLDSVQKIVTEYNKTCTATIEKLESNKGHCTCSANWVKMFENGPNGEVLFGDRNELIQAVLTGSSVKLLADKRYMTTVQNLRPVNGHLMAQALFHVSVSGRKFQDNAYWWFVLASTTGHWYMSRYNVGEHVSRGDNEIKYGMEWFIRRPCDMNPLLRILPDGTVAYGSIQNLKTAVRNGYPVRITTLKSGYTFPADNLEVSGDHVAAQTLWHISQQSTSDWIRMIFQKNAYWYFTIWATTGMKQMSRWNVGKHESRGSTSDKGLTDWFVDQCWKLVYRHGPRGNKIEGNKNILINSIRKGNRVRVVYRDFSFEPNVLFISDSDVHALSMDSVSKLSFDQFEDNVSWIWRSVSTDGTLKVLKTPVGNSQSTKTDERVQMAWFVDTREWKQIVSITDKDTDYSRSKADLLHYAGQGADVRVGVKHSDDNDFTYMQPDNIHLFHQESSLLAMHIRQATFHPDILPSWVFTLTNTEGLRDTSIWTLGEHKGISHKADQVNTVWFISE